MFRAFSTRGSGHGCLALCAQSPRLQCISSSPLPSIQAHFPRKIPSKSPKWGLRNECPRVPQCQLRPEGRNRRGETRLRGPEVLGPLRGLGIRPLVSVIRGLGNHFPGAPWSPRKALRGSGEALQGPRRGVSVFKGAGKEGGPFRGL